MDGGLPAVAELVVVEELAVDGDEVGADEADALQQVPKIEMEALDDHERGRALVGGVGRSGRERGQPGRDVTRKGARVGRVCECDIDGGDRLGGGLVRGIGRERQHVRQVQAHLDAALIAIKALVGGDEDGAGRLRHEAPQKLPPEQLVRIVFALQLLRIFQSFEIEQLLGVPFGFFVYPTMIFGMVRHEPPLYGQATALASITLLVVALIIPMQRWILERRHYTTITGSFKPGLVDLGKWKWPVFGVIGALIVLLTLFPAIILVLGSFMTRSGYFNIDPVFTLEHWRLVLTDNAFVDALKTTLILASTSALLSPLFFSILAYIMVRTRWPGRTALDYIIWGSAAIPGILSGLGLLWLFLGDFPPGSGFRPLVFLYGSLYALILVVIIQGNTTGTNVFKGAFVQVGRDMEEQARVSGAGRAATSHGPWARSRLRSTR